MYINAGCVEKPAKTRPENDFNHFHHADQYRLNYKSGKSIAQYQLRNINPMSTIAAADINRPHIDRPVLALVLNNKDTKNHAQRATF